MPIALSYSLMKEKACWHYLKCRDDLIRYATFNESDFALIRQRRGKRPIGWFCRSTLVIEVSGSCVDSEMKVIADSVIHWVAGQIRSGASLGLNALSAMEPGVDTFTILAVDQCAERINLI